MRILVTNDDGIYSPGLRALADAAEAFGEVLIVAPDVERSSAGHSITSSRPLTYLPTPRVGKNAFRVNGTPADCVALGCYHLKSVDIVLSGINLGSNLGNSVWHSGTLAAARQAALLQVRGVALSTPVQPDGADPDFEALQEPVVRVLKEVMNAPYPLLNVNFPTRSGDIHWTRQSVRHYDGEIVPGKDPLGRPHYWFTVKPVEEMEKGTDRWAISHGHISITPLRLDLTSLEDLTKAAL